MHSSTIVTEPTDFYLFPDSEDDGQHMRTELILLQKRKKQEEFIFCTLENQIQCSNMNKNYNSPFSI